MLLIDEYKHTYKIKYEYKEEGENFKIEIVTKQGLGEIKAEMKIFLNGCLLPNFEDIFYYRGASLQAHFKKIYSDKDLKIYIFQNIILYKKQEKFDYINVDNISLNSLNLSKKYITLIAEILREEYGWEYILRFGDLMISLGNEKYIKDYERLANEELTESEIKAINDAYGNESYEKWAISEAREMLKKYNLIYQN